MYQKEENGKIIYSSGKVIQINGAWVSNPTPEMLESAGWTESVSIINEPSEEDRQREEYEQMLEESREKMLELMEKWFANNTTGEVQEEASRRVTVRASLDSLGKIVQTEGDGTPFNPYKTWVPGTYVNAGEYWLTENGYLWEAIKSGIPSSENDSEYWDID